MTQRPGMTNPRQDDIDRSTGAGFLHGVIIYLVSLLVTLPLFTLVQPHLPGWRLSFAGGLQPDHLLVFIAMLVVVILVLRRFQFVVYVLVVLGLSTITITSFWGGYGFRELYADYTVLVHSLRESTKALPRVNELKPFTHAQDVLEAIDYQDPKVRSFAVRAATTWFANASIDEDEFTLVQSFSIFKVINSAWIYVSDPLDDEYFAKASESVELLAGDCDDHAILMAACIKAIGGEVRLVRTTGHIYPEMKVGNAKAMERAAFLIRQELFPDVAKHAALFYHTDGNGDRWINLDYTRHYPGGEVMAEDILGILPV